MKVFRRDDGAIVYQVETDEERAKARKTNKRPDFFNAFMKPQGTSISMKAYEAQSGLRQRKTTRGRKFRFHPIMQVVSSFRDMVKRKLAPTGRFRRERIK